MSRNIPSLQSNSLNFSPVLDWVEAADRPGVIVNGDLVKTVNIVQKVSQLILKQASTFSQMNHSLNSTDVDISSWMRWIPPLHSLDVSAHLFHSELKHLTKKLALQFALQLQLCLLRAQPYWDSCKSPAEHCQLHTWALLYTTLHAPYTSLLRFQHLNETHSFGIFTKKWL